MSHEPEWLIFPIINREGFKVDCAENYARMIKTIIEAQVELAVDYPEEKILVVYEVRDDI